MKIVPIVSGGLDSVTMLYHLLDRGDTIDTMVSFNYGQRHKKELGYAAKHAEALNIDHVTIDLYAAGLTSVLDRSSSSLTNPEIEVPEGHYAQENMKATVVPNRNMMMLAIAGSVAVATNANAIATGVHSGDHFIYPDCRPAFVVPLGLAFRLGNAGFANLLTDPILTPFINDTKADIAELAIESGIPLEQTWSCYKGGEIHCGRCGTCVERLEAIDTAYKLLGMENRDETEYADKDYWREALKNETVS